MIIIKVYNKLVRDEIPRIIIESGKVCNSKVLSSEEYTLELRKKMIEEAKELVDCETKDEAIEELADIYELIEAILKNEKIDWLEVQKKRIQKNIKKGAFEDRQFLISVE